MRVNYIVLVDIETAKPMISIKCGFCKSRDLIRNHISWIKDYIDDQNELYGCKNCGAKTRIHPDDIIAIKRKLNIKQI